MLKEITLKDIKEFQNQYNGNYKNKDIENDILNFGIKKVLIENNKNYDFKFNIEVPKMKIYDQFGSHQCNIFSFLRVVKDIIRNNTNLDVEKIDISANYIAFYDKLEKINSFYDDLLNESNLTIDFINNKIEKYIGSYGTFYFCKKIIDKYGFVPTKCMPEVDENYDENLTIELLRNKLKTDSLILKKITNLEEKEKIKQNLLYEAYSFLSKIYGNPPTEIKVNDEILAPINFKNKCLGNQLDDYVTVTSISKDALFDSYSFIPSVYLEDKEKIVKISKQDLQNIIIDQLKDNISVWFSSELSTTLDLDNGILEYNAYNFKEKLNIKEINLEDRIKLDIINYDHAMCITGALVEDNKVIQYKVDNSFGNYGKYNGYLIMTPLFLENCVITIIINKKYLSKYMGKQI